MPFSTFYIPRYICYQLGRHVLGDFKAQDNIISTTKIRWRDKTKYACRAEYKFTEKLWWETKPNNPIDLTTNAPPKTGPFWHCGSIEEVDRLRLSSGEEKMERDSFEAGYYVQVHTLDSSILAKFMIRQDVQLISHYVYLYAKISQCQYDETR